MATPQVKMATPKVFFFQMVTTLLLDSTGANLTPLKINMEHNHGGLEDHFPFQMGDL